MLVFLGATRLSWRFAWGAKGHAANYTLPIFKPLKPRLVSTVFTEFPLFSGAFSAVPVILAVFISPICLYGRMVAAQEPRLWPPNRLQCIWLNWQERAL